MRFKDMSELAVVIVSTDEQQAAVLQMQVDATAVARTLHTCPGYPQAASDPALRRVRESNAAIVIVEVPRQNSADALRAIELLRIEAPDCTIFALGDLSQPQLIINSMRSGAREFLERPTSTSALLDAFVRMTSSERKTQAQGQRGKVFTFVNAKGGCGATTLAVNTAIHLQQQDGGTVLVDLAPLGNASLHLNVRPGYSVADALVNAHRLDQALLESFLTPCDGDLQLLAGVTEPLGDGVVTGELARLMDILVSRFRYVVVDVSSRLDAAAKLVCDLSDEVMIVAQTDVASLWSAAKLQEFLGHSGGNKLRLVINRFRKIPGLKESDIESATRMKIAHSVPNNYLAVAGSIERGCPVSQQNHSEISRSMNELAGVLSNQPVAKKRRQFSIF
jgi:pilus assembly protein CpaE